VRIPVKLIYACRVLVQLGVGRVEGGLRRLEELAERESISSNYLVQILHDLRGAGLVESRRGKHGGYRLAVAPDKIRLLDVARALEGELLEVEADYSGESGEVVAVAWKAVAEGLEGILAGVTLEQLARGGGGDNWQI
jgi:Rrf2 family transcriptional regulator, cysteine metabolism repressor